MDHTRYLQSIYIYYVLKIERACVGVMLILTEVQTFKV